MTFEEMITEVEMAIEKPLQSIDAFHSDLAGTIYDRMTALQNAIDQWREG